MSDALTAGENFYFNTIKDKVKVIFDVGAQKSEFLNTPCEIHYFEPIVWEFEKLKSSSNINTKSYFNCFALGKEEKENVPHYNSGALFYRPSISSGNNIDLTCTVIKGKRYVIENAITDIDFLKIDVEGYELEVLQGFEDTLSIVKYIQFESGPGLLDNKKSLEEVVEYLQQHGFINFRIQEANSLKPLLVKDTHIWQNIVCENRDKV